MQRCFELARLGGKYTQKNPMVGAVIVYQDKIIGEGYHKIYGNAHAEVNAFESIKPEDKQLLEDASIYISLEPCFHQGKTPPCVDTILQHNIKKVYISCLDPFEKVAGKSVEKLRANGVEVHTGISEKQGKNLIRKFIANTIEKRCYVILKFAQSKDGYIGKKDKAVWLTNTFSKTLVHKWRSEIDGIMIGTQTAITDNPELTNRLYTGDNPLRIILDRQNKIPATHKVLSDDYPSLIFTTDHSHSKRHSKECIVLQDWKLQSILQSLYERGIYSLFVEGGKTLLESFISEELWDEYRILTTDNNLDSGIKAPLIQAQKISQERLYTDLITYGYLK